jgi:hypothetical protein
MRNPDHPAFRILWSAIAALVLLATVGLVLGPGRGIRSDIARQRELVAQQLAVTRSQLALAREQRKISEQSLDVARTQLEIARAQLARTDMSLDLQRQLLAIAQATLEQAKELNRKTPDLKPSR